MRLIDADYAKEAVTYIPWCDYRQVQSTIDECPTIDAAPAQHGRWEWFEEWSQSTTEYQAECQDCGWRCSECKTALEDIVGGYWDDIDREPMMNYCPNCGSKMDGERKDNG